jgi:hypothetical protein
MNNDLHDFEQFMQRREEAAVKCQLELPASTHALRNEHQGAGTAGRPR